MLDKPKFSDKNDNNTFVLDNGHVISKNKLQGCSTTARYF